MTPSGPRAFLPALRRLDRELAVPVQHRVRILRELEYDLEGLRSHFVERGLSPDEAYDRAVAALVPDGPAMSALARVHEPWLRRVTRLLPQARLRALERGALAAAVVSVVGAEGWALLRSDLLSDPSPFLLPVLCLGGVLAVAALALALRVGLAGGVRPEGGARLLLVLSAGILLAGVTGAGVDSYRLAAHLERAPSQAGTLVLKWLERDAGLLCVSLLVALAGGLAWFALTQWISFLDAARRDALGLADFPPRET